ncbi:MAG: hypothetical protein EBR47_06460 [Betaproteobacteria bacterium]|nr:hypothetical protein [Betaproteobacteria bacterium]
MAYFSLAKKSTSLKVIFSIMLVVVSAMAFGQSRIVCDPIAKDSKRWTSIWPEPYLSEKGELCFDVKGWTGFKGQNCVVRNGERIHWEAILIMFIDGQSVGRDDTYFRVDKPTVSSELISYQIMWRRSQDWRLLQNIHINRLTGKAISYFTDEHGGESYDCRLEKRKI